MNILILTFGSRGDVQPYVALGNGLKARGHTVTICTCSRFSAFVTDHGLIHARADDGILEMMDSVEGRRAMEDASSVFGMLKTMKRLWKQVKPVMRQILQDSWEAAQQAKPDIIIYHPKGIGAVAIAEKLGIQAILAMPFPMLVPTAENPSIGLPDWKLGGWYNKATYKLVHKVSLWTVGKLTRVWRMSHGLPPRICGIDFLHTPAGDPIPVLHGYSPKVSPQPGDWPDTAHVTGYWFLDRLPGWKPPKALRDFLAAGEAPIYVGFGSMSGRNPRRLASIVIEALQQANMRGILSAGWGGLVADALPDSILMIDGAPHDWLFPRVSAVVHHGGAGTTAAGLRAGRPSVICPFFGDQGFWGKCVHALGVGPAPLAQKKLTVEKLARALRAVVVGDTMRERAALLGEQIRGEDGVSNAVAIIERSYSTFSGSLR